MRHGEVRQSFCSGTSIWAPNIVNVCTISTAYCLCHTSLNSIVFIDVRNSKQTFTFSTWNTLLMHSWTMLSCSTATERKTTWQTANMPAFSIQSQCNIYKPNFEQHRPGAQPVCWQLPWPIVGSKLPQCSGVVPQLNKIKFNECNLLTVLFNFYWSYKPCALQHWPAGQPWVLQLPLLNGMLSQCSGVFPQKPNLEQHKPCGQPFVWQSPYFISFWQCSIVAPQLNDRHAFDQDHWHVKPMIDLYLVKCLLSVLWATLTDGTTVNKACATTLLLAWKLKR
jgi:hypothetical protein